MKGKPEIVPAVDQLALRADAAWLRTQADWLDGLAAQSTEAASVEHEHLSRIAAAYPDFAAPPELPSSGVPWVSEIGGADDDGGEDDPFARDAEYFLSVAGKERPVRELPADPPDGLTGAQQRFKDAWLRATEPAQIKPKYMIPTVADFTGEEPRDFPLSDVVVQASARPRRAATYYASPETGASVSSDRFMAETDHLGFSVAWETSTVRRARA